MRWVEHMMETSILDSMDAALTTFLHKVLSHAKRSTKQRASPEAVSTALDDTTHRLIHDTQLRAAELFKTILTMALVPGLTRALGDSMQVGPNRSVYVCSPAVVDT